MSKKLTCTIDDNNKHSGNSIKVMFRDDEKKKKKCIVTKEQLAGHVSEPLTKILYPMIKEWRILSVKAIITGGKRRESEGTWVLASGIELSCIHHIYAAKTHKNLIRKKLGNEEKNTILSKT